MKKNKLIELLQAIEGNPDVYSVSVDNFPELVGSPSVIYAEEKDGDFIYSYTKSKDEAFDWNYHVKAILL